ncbi:dihydroxyacetone kinase subunit DhaL [Methylomarinum vadi]|uniref:dihydroxyacetone kinase subunit DhaL n=1 Tax=Methylomarinum vadi TaxID=438855 RepID=UPI0004DF6314|nr:dihydroxyacetone kinase subunit DhaL [Methylomarinum vadi]
MQITPQLLPEMIEAIDQAISANAEEVTALDQEIGDGDHVYNLQRGIEALKSQEQDFAALDWVAAWQKIGMTMMSKIGGASGSLYGSLFVTMSKAAKDRQMDLSVFANAFAEGVESIKKRGRADVGEKTMLDVWVPVVECLQDAASEGLSESELLDKINEVAEAGVEATRDMVAKKGRASFLGERTIGHIDAGAKTAQLMIAAVCSVVGKQL